MKHFLLLIIRYRPAPSRCFEGYEAKDLVLCLVYIYSEELPLFRCQKECGGRKAQLSTTCYDWFTQYLQCWHGKHMSLKFMMSDHQVLSPYVKCGCQQLTQSIKWQSVHIFGTCSRGEVIFYIKANFQLTDVTFWDVCKSERYPQENSAVDPPMNNWDHRDYHAHQHGHDYHHYDRPHCHDQVFCHLPLAVKNERLECPLPIRMLALLRANPIWPFHRPAPALVSSDFIAPPPHTLCPPSPSYTASRMRDPWENDLFQQRRMATDLPGWNIW